MLHVSDRDRMLYPANRGQGGVTEFADGLVALGAVSSAVEPD